MTRVLMIGWDGTTWDLVKPWMERGELPVLAELVRRGVSGALRSVPTMNSGPAWTTINTGLNPGQHGIYSLVDWVDGKYELRPLKGTDRHGKTLWQRVSEAGKRVMVMNFPVTYPADPVNGVFIAGMDAPSSHSPRFGYPDKVVQDLLAEEDSYILAARVGSLIRSGRKTKALARIHQMIDGRLNVALQLLDREPWDLCQILFNASDVAQHFFWEDLNGGKHRDAIHQVFRHLDKALGQLLDHAGSDVAVVLLSDHGFGAYKPGVRYVNDFLAGLGLLSYRTERRERRGWMRSLYLKLDQWLPHRLKAWLVQTFPNLFYRATAGLWLQNIDWTATRAFSIAGSSRIWINLEGRQPQGIVTPGDEYERIIERIQVAMGNAVDPRTGARAVRAVRHRDELYHGPFIQRAHDLLVEWEEVENLAGLAWYGDDRTVVAKKGIAHQRNPINGSHRQEGILVMHGQAFKEGDVVQGATLYDITPTVLYLLDEPVPSNFDGRILRQAFRDDWLQANPPAWIETEDWGESAHHTDIDEDDDAVLDRLRGLGYVD